MSENKNNYPYKTAGITAPLVYEIEANTEADIPSDSAHPDPVTGKYDTKYWSPGSICTVLSTGNTYKLNTEKKWVFWTSEQVGTTYGYYENNQFFDSTPQIIGTYKDKKVYRKIWMDTIKNDGPHYSSTSQTLKLLVEIIDKTSFINNVLNMTCTFFTKISSAQSISDECQKITFHTNVNDNYPFRVLIPDDLWNNWLGGSSTHETLAVLTVDYLDD